MAAYTPTGLDILAKVMNKSGMQQIQSGKLAKYIGKCFTFFKFLDLIVESAIVAFSDPYFNKGSGQ